MIALVVVLVIIGQLTILIYVAGVRTRDSNVTRDVYLLCMWLEAYRDEHSEYPNTLGDLANLFEDVKEGATGTNGFLNSLNGVLHNKWDDQYTYTRLTNRFIISVKGRDAAPVGWFGGQYRLSRTNIWDGGVAHGRVYP